MKKFCEILAIAAICSILLGIVGGMGVSVAENPTLLYETGHIRITPAGQHAGKLTVGDDGTLADTNALNAAMAALSNWTASAYALISTVNTQVWTASQYPLAALTSTVNTQVWVVAQIPAVFSTSFVDSASVTWLDNGNRTWTATAASGGVTATNFQLICNGYAAHGSTDTMIPRFTTTVTNVGEGIAWVYSTNAPNGSTLTILQDGMYAVSVDWNAKTAAAEDAVGITRNEVLLTLTNLVTYMTQPQLIAIEDQVINSGGYNPLNPNFTLPLASGDVIRVHSRGAAPGVPANCNLRAAQIWKK